MVLAFQRSTYFRLEMAIKQHFKQYANDYFIKMDLEELPYQQHKAINHNCTNGFIRSNKIVVQAVNRANKRFVFIHQHSLARVQVSDPGSSGILIAAVKNGLDKRKPVFEVLRTAKVQTSLRIRAG